MRSGCNPTLQQGDLSLHFEPELAGEITFTLDFEQCSIIHCNYRYHLRTNANVHHVEHPISGKKILTLCMVVKMTRTYHTKLEGENVSI